MTTATPTHPPTAAESGPVWVEYDDPTLDVDSIRAAAYHAARDAGLTRLQLLAVGELYAARVAVLAAGVDGLAAWLPGQCLVGVWSGCGVSGVLLGLTLTVSAAVAAPDPGLVAACVAAVAGRSRAGTLLHA